MIVAIDVYYTLKLAKSVGVIFDWSDEFPSHVIVDEFDVESDYILGEFFRRELPCILRILHKINQASVAANYY